MIIGHNVNAMFAYMQMSILQGKISKSMERLSSGLRINRAADDPAGLAISERMRGQIRGLQMASRNAQDGISMLQTAEGALNETHAMLQRMNELAVQAANGTYSDQDRAQINKEFQQLKEEITRSANQTEFNTKPLLGKDNNEIIIQIGANANQNMAIKLESMTGSALSLDDVDISTQENASKAIKKVQDAIDKTSSFRGTLGAYENRLEHVISINDNTAENLEAAESRIRDVDIAKEMMEYAKNSILYQVAQAMLAQSNQQAKSVLELLKSLP
ncbi:flagellin [Clostridium sp. YIM B02515]|uniref:Flagellin n=1 Tax=Clostridium rhizosphaerae TaxID=2803861 RepID=A0ABS1TD46_9CLOT|nr:flagellin [Clostridium rhizosphaerae]MBL4937032.1 flagellin [Clostridium rhizosphaerae]